MVVDLAQRDALAKRLSELALELHKSNVQLQEMQVFVAAVPKTVSKLHDSVEKAALQPEQKDWLEKELQQQRLLESFAVLQGHVHRLKQLVSDLEEPLLQESLFLEKHRAYRFYQFVSQDQSLRFLLELADLYSIQQFVFKPEFMGLVNFAPLKRELNLAMHDNASFVVLPNQLEFVFGFLAANQFSKNFVLSADSVKLVFQSPLLVKVEAANLVLQRLDRMAIAAEGKVLEK